MHELVIRTRRSFSCSASSVWELLCNSQMEDTTTLLFKLGVPQPVACRVPEGRGGVGGERECVSNKGIVHQRILEWSPPSSMSFRLERTDFQLPRYVHNIVERFDVTKTTSGTEVTRTTRVATQGRFQLFHRVVLFLSLKQVHRYVFRNWQRSSRAVSPVTAGPEGASATASTL